MKTLTLIALLTLLALHCFGQATAYNSQLPDPDGIAGQVLWWQGVRYELKLVAANDENTITFDTNAGKIQLPWAQVPGTVKSKCWKQREDALEEASKAKLAALQAKAQALGIVEVGGSVIQVLGNGVLVAGGNGQNIFLKGLSGVVDGDVVCAWAKVDGTFSYTTVLGASATVHAYDYLSPHP